MLDGLSAEILARVQFAFMVSFHIIFPAFSIGLASYLAVLNGLWLRTRNEVYLNLFNYWKKIFAVAFGMGVVSGIVMSYQFGTNWAVFSERTGPILGPLMAYEVLTAFFLEAGFLGIMLFGRGRVGDGLHMLATAMVAFGTVVSATWILSVNSWMQTPAGYSINELGQFVPEDWWAIVFNPSFPYRLAHMVVASFLTTAFVVAGVSAWYLLKRRFEDIGRAGLSLGLLMATLLAPTQIFVGDLHGLNVLEHQPMKVAAMEGLWETGTGAPLVLFAWPDQEGQENRFAIEIPGLASLILTKALDGEVRGLNDVPREDQP
ncbi:MAG: cytochrome ubiquinol oxidase subunit I, partial [Rhodobacteraceae bacterium]|nr:cytochrome ubiquinol oxidase subunit I [Paracoccaceae bacterium]